MSDELVNEWEILKDLVDDSSTHEVFISEDSFDYPEKYRTTWQQLNKN